MAFVNNEGMKISHECEDLIQELQEDIAEFGDDLEVDVITFFSCGVKLYEDYNFILDDEESFDDVQENETVERMKAVDLLKLYIQQDSPF